MPTGSTYWCSRSGSPVIPASHKILATEFVWLVDAATNKRADMSVCFFGGYKQTQVLTTSTTK